MDSILNSVKKMLGIEADDSSFDTDIIIHINSALMTLSQLGIGPVNGFSIIGASEVWSQLTLTNPNLEGVKTYVYLKVRLVFDPPSTSFVIEAYSKQIAELEWRLIVQAETPTTP